MKLSANSKNTDNKVEQTIEHYTHDALKDLIGDAYVYPPPELYTDTRKITEFKFIMIDHMRASRAVDTQLTVSFFIPPLLSVNEHEDIGLVYQTHLRKILLHFKEALGIDLKLKVKPNFSKDVNKYLDVQHMHNHWQYRSTELIEIQMRGTLTDWILKNALSLMTAQLHYYFKTNFVDTRAKIARSKALSALIGRKSRLDLIMRETLIRLGDLGHSQITRDHIESMTAEPPQAYKDRFYGNSGQPGVDLSQADIETTIALLSKTTEIDKYHAGPWLFKKELDAKILNELFEYKLASAKSLSQKLSRMSDRPSKPKAVNDKPSTESVSSTEKCNVIFLRTHKK